MPARDPATTPHLPTASVGTLSLASDAPANESQHIPHAMSPSSSSRSVPQTNPQSSGGGAEPARRRRSSRRDDEHRGNVVTSMLRKVSGGGSSSTATTASDEERGVGISGPRRRRSADVESHYGALSMSSSNQAIRDSSNRLASLSFASSHVTRPSLSSGEFMISPTNSRSHHPAQPRSFSGAGAPFAMSRKPPSHLHESVTVEPAASLDALMSSPKSTSDLDAANGSLSQGGMPNGPERSGLTLLLERERAKKGEPANSPIKEDAEMDDEATPKPSQKTSLDSSPTSITPIATSLQKTSPLSRYPQDRRYGDGLKPGEPSKKPVVSEDASSTLRQYLAEETGGSDADDEGSPLLGHQTPGKSVKAKPWRSWNRRMKKVTARDIARSCIEDPIKTLPSVILGVLLNVLDGVSYGMILFPATPVFTNFGSLGVSMFFMSCIVSQLVFSLGGSIFPAGNGSMMIEAVPFFHILINIIQAEVGDDPHAIIATTMVAFAFSSILTGFVFFVLGAFRLGALVGYFPRHILVGCIGGVGIFLIQTGLEVSRGLKEEGFAYNLDTLKLFFQSPHMVLLWTIPLVLAIMLRVITHFFHHQLIFPAYFFIIPLIFYAVIAIGKWSFEDLRVTGWVFDVGSDTQAWWKFYTQFDFGKTNWKAFWAGMPTQLALVFFGILHVPLNVPALGVTLCEDNVKLDRELIAHGVSNLAAGLTGTVPNYLTYVNSVLFYRVGGGSRLSGIMLAIGTIAIMMVGPSVIGYLPVMVVGALIYVLGIDLLLEAVWDTRHKVNRMEYITIWAIAIGMTAWDFVIGLLFGIILACIFFVVQNSRRRAVRAVFNGSIAKSTVRRPRAQREFIQQVGSQTYVMKLQGFLFFGTISAVEDQIRRLLDMAQWQHHPIRFLILDFTLVAALDFSSAEAFARVQRLLAAKDVLLILCGAAPNGLVSTALKGVDLWADREGTTVEVFDSLNQALEWTENAYLTAFYENQMKAEQNDEMGSQIIDFPKVKKTPFSLAESFENSPRRTHLAKAGGDTLPNSYLHIEPEDEDEVAAQPLPLLMHSLGSYAADSLPDDFYRSLVPYFHQEIIPQNTTIWTQSDPADGLYVIESGSLRATYMHGDHGMFVSETMVAGTIAGDLSTLSDTRRNATVVSERECVVWKLSKGRLEEMQRDDPNLAMALMQVVLRAVAEEQDVLSSHLIAVLS